MAAVQLPLSLSSLPKDILSAIFSRLSCEKSLLGSVAKVNREFREIANNPSTRKCVQENFMRVHREQCSACVEVTETPLTGFFIAHLSSVAKKGSLGCVMFLCHSADAKEVYQQCFRGHTVFHAAVSGGSVDVIRYFIEERGYTDVAGLVNGAGGTVLHCAATCGQVDAIRFFVEERGDVDLINVPDKSGQTLLHSAAVFDRVNVVRYLVEERGNATNLLEKKDNYGKTALDLAGSDDVKKCLSQL
eukprot:Rmarinus@m.7761